MEIMIDNKDPVPALLSKLNFLLLGLFLPLIVIVMSASLAESASSYARFVLPTSYSHLLPPPTATTTTVMGAIFLCPNSRMQVAASQLLLPAAGAVVLPLGGRLRKEVLPLKDVEALPTVRVGGARLTKTGSAGGRRQRQQLDDALAFFPPSPPTSPSTRRARGFENDVCAICLSEFEVGEVLKLLPCGGRHAFHAECITPWLTERSRTCPLCKVKIVPSSVAPSSSAETSVAGEMTEEEELKEEESGGGGLSLSVPRQQQEQDAREGEGRV